MKAESLKAEGVAVSLFQLPDKGFFGNIITLTKISPHEDKFRARSLVPPAMWATHGCSNTETIPLPTD